MKCIHTYLSRCLALLLVICITDQLSSVTGHSLKLTAARKEKIADKRMEEILNRIRNERTLNQRTITKRQIMSARLDHLINLQSDMPHNRIGGLATRGNKLYVGYGEFEQSTVDIYDASTFRLASRLNVTGLLCPSDMATCPDCDVVFIADPCTNKIHVIDDLRQLRTQWSVEDMPYGISVNSQSNVIVTFLWTNELREYTPSGELVREIALSSTIDNPLDAIQLDNDRFVVSHGLFPSSQHRVCIVNGDGVVVQCYGGQNGSGVGQLDFPFRLEIVGESLLVADNRNYRVVQFDVSSLTYIGELINTRSEERKPAKMALNEDGAQLYVYSFADPDDPNPIKVYTLITR